MGQHKGRKSTDKPSNKRYKAEGRNQKNKLRRLKKHLKHFLKLKATAAKLGKKTKVDKVIANLEAAIKKYGQSHINISSF